MKTKYSFWELLNDYKIEIPKIQRDYAQGRKDPGIAKIVDKFLNDIQHSIRTNEELNLDFVYGRVEENILIPLDGQQRLTTLFLIHWYIALKEDRLTEETKATLSRFTYETRVSSDDFCRNLVSENIDYKLIDGSISNAITDSKWYFLSWALDPTVLAMLNMLDLIHEKFKDLEEQIFNRLEQEINITFHFMPLEKFKLADELYIKMNARGKPLTEFESFKANFSQYLHPLEEKSKLDNEWLDLFWNLSKSEASGIVTESIDENIYNYFTNITLNIYTENNDIDKEFVNDFNLFETYAKVYQEQGAVSQVTKIFEALIDYEDTEHIFKDFLSPNVNYWERLRFYSLGHFFIQYGKVTNENQDILGRWLRITNNLISNTRIEGAKEYENGIRSINSLSKDISDIYTYISSSSDNIQYFTKLQRAEESLKARLIIDDEAWEALFVKIEQHSYFDGQIGFILEYSKIDEGSYDKNLFHSYSEKLSKLFSHEFRENHEFLFQRALLAKGNYLPRVGKSENITFCTFEEALRTKNDNWRKVFNDEDDTLILKALLDDIDGEDIRVNLETIISSQSSNNWTKLVIDDPGNISYCQYRQIRWYSDDSVYLLSKAQMNGRHRELFSWDLFNRKYSQKLYSPFSDESWYWESTSWDQPCIVISSFNYYENNFVIELSHESDDKYLLCLKDWNNAELPSIIEELLVELDFNKSEILLREAEIDEKIEEICNKLKEIENG